MKKHVFELNGYISTHSENSEGDDVYLEEKNQQDDEYYYPKTDSVGTLVSAHFSKLSKPFKVSMDDWTRGDFVHYKSVFVQYYITDKETTWEEAKKSHIRQLAGDLNVEDRCDGYSEYTIVDSWVDIFVGGHDLRTELKSHRWKYALIRITYKA